MRYDPGPRHPGEINLNEKLETAQFLFRLLDIIVEKMIAEEKEFDKLYDSLPAGKLRAIEERDAPKP